MEVAALGSKHAYYFDFVTSNEHRLGVLVWSNNEDYDSSKAVLKVLRESVCRTTKFYLPPDLQISVVFQNSLSVEILFR